ncbi:hypothetical protein Tco_0877851 [Tanacetum coccineum]|uniref:Transposase (putative) gypsy type domain-containing protein n=1 Tax=Tanacetum coccineum TaxID=301880 RepID=A0ABQ5BWB9_9ASTR
MAEVHPTAPGRDKTIAQFPAGKVGVYTRIFDVCGYRIPFTKFFMAVLKYFRVYISQLSPFGAARVSHFEVLTRVLDLSPSVTVFRAFYTRTFSDGLFSFAKRSTSALSCFPKPPNSIKNWADHFFWVDSCVFPISVPLYTGGVLEKDPAPHLTPRQEQTVKLLETHKAHFRQYPECFLCLVGLSPYYPFDDNSYPAFEHPDGTDMGLLDFIKTADPRKVRAMEVQKGDDQVTLLESTRHCFMPLVILAAGGSSFVATTEIPGLTESGQEGVAEENAYLELADLDEGTAMVRQSDEEVVTEQPKKTKKKRLIKQSNVLPAKKLRTDHPSLAYGLGGRTDLGKIISGRSPFAVSKYGGYGGGVYRAGAGGRGGGGGSAGCLRWNNPPVGRGGGAVVGALVNGSQKKAKKQNKGKSKLLRPGSLVCWSRDGKGRGNSLFGLGEETVLGGKGKKGNGDKRDKTCGTGGTTGGGNRTGGGKGKREENGGKGCEGGRRGGGHPKTEHYASRFALTVGRALLCDVPPGVVLTNDSLLDDASLPYLGGPRCSPCSIFLSLFHGRDNYIRSLMSGGSTKNMHWVRVVGGGKERKTQRDPRVNLFQLAEKELTEEGKA